MLNISEQSSQHQPLVIWWLRRDLRLHDNPALYHALRSGYPVLPLFIFDKLILESLTDKKDKRVSFIYKTLQILNNELIKYGSSLYVLHDTPLEAFKTITNRFQIREVFTNHDYEPYAIERDHKITEFLREGHITFNSYKDHVVFEKSEILKADGEPYTVYSPYSRTWKQRFSDVKNINFPSESILTNLYKIKPLELPSIRSIGFEDAGITFSGLQVNEQIIRDYEHTRNIPSVEGTSRVSVHLRFGTVSIRQLARLADDLSEHWLNELIWREFFIMILFHFPYVIHGSFKKKYDKLQWRNNPEELESWCKGETGYPLVDAGMRQLNETGWMHNRVRMIVASFLTKHLLTDWRLGEAYFAEKLLDYELASNNGNWQWAAGSGCDAAPYFRIFNPSEQIRKFDPELKYIMKWIPGFIPGYIYPIVEHNFARKRALEVYKQSLNG